MKVFVALNAVPDYSAPSPSFRSVHLTLEGAKRSLFPGRDPVSWRMWRDGIWAGPDGYGEIREVEVLP